MLSKKTKKGQPNLNLQMEYLLQKIQGTGKWLSCRTWFWTITWKSVDPARIWVLHKEEKCWGQWSFCFSHTENTSVIVTERVLLKEWSETIFCFYFEQFCILSLKALCRAGYSNVRPQEGVVRHEEMEGKKHASLHDYYKSINVEKCCYFERKTPLNSLFAVYCHDFKRKFSY